MNDKGRGRLLSSAGIGVAALVPAAGLALLAAQVSSAGYVLPAAVNTLATTILRDYPNDYPADARWTIRVDALPGKWGAARTVRRDGD